MAIAQTSRLLLQKPSDIELISNGDNILTDNYENIDLNVHQRIVANTADVVNPYEGQSIYATVPGENYVYKYGAWVRVDGDMPPPAPGSRGWKGSYWNGNAQQYNMGLVDQLISSVTFTVEAGRTYLIHWNTNAIKTNDDTPPDMSNGFVGINWRFAIGGTVSNTDAQIGLRRNYRVYSYRIALGFTRTGHDLNGFIEMPSVISDEITLGMFYYPHDSLTWFRNYTGAADTTFSVIDWGETT